LVDESFFSCVGGHKYIPVLFEMDFLAALISGGKEGKKIGRLCYIQNNQFGLVLPNAFPIIGRDGERNYWLSGYLNKGNWERIEGLLSESSSICEGDFYRGINLQL